MRRRTLPGREDFAMRAKRDRSFSLRHVAVALAATMLSCAAQAEGLPRAQPEQVGLSSDRLARLSQMVRDDTAKGQIAGAVMLIARRGKVAYLESFGLR